MNKKIKIKFFEKESNLNLSDETFGFLLKSLIEKWNILKIHEEHQLTFSRNFFMIYFNSIENKKKKRKEIEKELYFLNAKTYPIIVKISSNYRVQQKK